MGESGRGTAVVTVATPAPTSPTVTLGTALGVYLFNRRIVVIYSVQLLTQTNTDEPHYRRLGVHGDSVAFLSSD